MRIPHVKELWLLWNIELRDWAIAVDDPDPEVAYLWAKSFKAAVALQKHPLENYEIKSVPIRVI